VLVSGCKSAESWTLDAMADNCSWKILHQVFSPSLLKTENAPGKMAFSEGEKFREIRGPTGITGVQP
jgi:hypothetical protein